MDIRDCIADLLSMHDCVIIPGFGGFIGNRSPSRIDPVRQIIHPPSKSILFNVNLVQNDGLLANTVAGSFGTSYQEACRLIDRFAEQCLHDLGKGEPVQFPSIGKLIAGVEGNIMFEQDGEANLLPDSFGLVTVTAADLALHTALTPDDRREPSKMTDAGHGKPLIGRALRWAAVISLPVGIAGMIALSYHGRNPEGFTGSAGIMHSVISRFSAASLVEKKAMPVPPKTRPVQAAPKPVTVTPPVETTAAVPVPENRFAVIVGAFRVKENAEKLVSELCAKGTDASIFDRSKTGLYRVTVGAFANREEACSLLAATRSDAFSGAWLLAK